MALEVQLYVSPGTAMAFYGKVLLLGLRLVVLNWWVDLLFVNYFGFWVTSSLIVLCSIDSLMGAAAA